MHGLASTQNVQALAVPRFTITDLGVLPGATESFALGINSAAWVVGAVQIESGAIRAFLHTGSITRAVPSNSPLNVLGTLGGTTSIAAGIDAVGRVVGDSLTVTGEPHAFYWPRGGPLQDLGTLGGTQSSATAIVLDHSATPLLGRVVGSAETGTGLIHAFLFTGGGNLEDLGTLGGRYSSAHAVNSSGQIAGCSENAVGAAHAFLWDHGVMRDLGTLGGRVSSAAGVNINGQVVGNAENASRSIHAFLWDNSVMKDLGTLGGQASLATAINAAGWVVGLSENAGGSSQAFLYNGSMTNLNSLLPVASGWELLSATGINDSGQIVGHGRYRDQSHAFLLTPVRSQP